MRSCWFDDDFSGPQYALMLPSTRIEGVANGHAGGLGGAVPIRFTIDPARVAAAAAADFAVQGLAGFAVARRQLAEGRVALTLLVEMAALLGIEEEAAERRGFGLAGGAG